jgi:hypothetical protein
MLDKTRAVKVNVDIDGAGRCDQPFAVSHRRATRNYQARINAVHDGRIAGLSNTDDAATADAKVAFNDPENGIDNDDIAKQEIQRSLGAGDSGHADSIPKGFASAMQAFVTINGVIPFDDRS